MNLSRLWAPLQRAICPLAAGLLLALPRAALAEYPEQPVRVFVAFPAGSAVDVVARSIVSRLAGPLGQPVVIENKVGAGGNIGFELAARAPKDGYALLFAPTQLAANPGRAKARPGTLSYASGGNGGIGHFSGELLKTNGGNLDIVHIPYKSAAEQVQSVMANQTAFAYPAMQLALQQVRSGKLRALAVTGANRSPLLPNVPTMSEAMNPGFVLDAFNVPQRDIELCRAVRKAVRTDATLMLDVAKSYDRAGAPRVGRVLEELAFAWFEEPLPQCDIEGYAELRRRLDIPLIGAETVAGHVYSAANYLRPEALDMLLCDVYWKAGVSGMHKTAVLCETLGVKVASHHAASPLMNWANLHVLCGATNADWMEVLVPEAGYDFGMQRYLAPDADGYLTAPRESGIGVALDWDYIRAHTVPGSELVALVDRPGLRSGAWSRRPTAAGAFA